jgi:hypothetical protein
MSRALNFAALLTLATSALADFAPAADYRGMPAAWPAFPNGYYAANYPTNYGAPAYYVARPVTAQYAPAAAPARVAYMPVNAAYANPTYFAAYGAAPAAARAPVAAYYPQTQAAYYAPQAGAYYAPTTANYAPNFSYAVSPAGSVSAGSEAAAYMQPSLNYVPARTTYRPAYAAVPVYAYSPVTAYQPAAYGQPNTCYQPAPAAPCQSSCRSSFSWLNPFTWFRHGCGRPACGAAPTTAYCTSGCGQPYYPVQPVIPVVPAPTGPMIVTPPTTVTPSIQGTPRIPAPGTRFPSTTLPADIRPSLTPLPGGSFTPAPSGGSFTPVPGPATVTPSGPTTVTPAPGGSFPTTPSTVPGFGSPGSFTPSGTNYVPNTDPYNSPSMTRGATAGLSSSASPNTTFQTPASAVIRAPELNPALPPTIRAVPDLDAPQAPNPVNHAPQLLDPRDKTAARAHGRWAVIPAVWPKKEAPAHNAVVARSPDRATSDVMARSPDRATTPALGATAGSPSRAVQVTPNPADYDDRGWRSASGL